MLIGSKAFRNLWEDWQRDYQPLQVLKLLLAYIGMPEDLSGELEETQHLLSYFDPDLAPHDSFWKDVVKLVDLAFPGDSLSKNASIERQIHQLRYLISSQQSQYVRTHYKKPGMTDKEALAVCSKMSRDNARTPVQWSDSDNAGFTTGTPWLKVNSNYNDINVQNQENDPDSVLNYYRKLVATRKSPEYKEVFTYGVFEPAYEDTEYVMAYYRVSDNQRILVAANFGKDAKTIELKFPVKKVVLSNVGRKEINEVSLKLDSCEVIVIECGE